MARIQPKKPSNMGVRFKDISAQIGSLPVFRENPSDPAGVSLFKGIAAYGAMGGGIGGPVGAVIGGAAGLVLSIFGIGNKKEAERRARQERRRIFEENKRRYEESFVESRRKQLSGIKQGLKKEVRDMTSYLHQGLGTQVSRMQSPQRALSFQQTGLLGKMKSATWNNLIASEAQRIAFRTEDAIRLRDQVVGDIDNWQERIEEEGYEAAKGKDGEVYKLKEGLEGLG